MSIKTTHSVTREFAIEVIRKKLDDKNTTDEQIANMLEDAIHNGYYNFCIVDEDEIQEMKWNETLGNCEIFYLDEINNLPEYNDVH